jgi:hypothetical protein
MKAMTAANDMPPEWLPGLDALRRLPEGGAALLIGGTDRGKTTFTTIAARILAAEFERVAIIDADIGQSEIGPPGTVGVAWATADAAKLHDLKPAAVFFVGAFAPVTVALEQVVAVAQAAQWARARGATRILIDTTGFISGPAARRLKAAKAQAAQPKLVLGIARDGELGDLLAVTGAVSGAETLLLPVPETVGRKSTTLRQTRRLARLSQALTKAREVVPAALSGIDRRRYPGDGREAAAASGAVGRETRYASPPVYAEKADNTADSFLSGPAGAFRLGERRDPGRRALSAHGTVRALSLDAYRNTYLGCTTPPDVCSAWAAFSILTRTARR